MIKTVTLSGGEVEVTGLDGFNTVVHNLSNDVVYASKYPNISAGEDNVAEVPAGAAKLISTTNGTVYLSGTGKVELTGQDYEGVNCSSPSPAPYSGTSDVTKAYVEAQDALNLKAANSYTDAVKEDIEEKLAAVSNPNLLDNWYFADPINQRGQKEYTKTGYTVDRWITSITGGKGTISVNNGVITIHGTPDTGETVRITFGQKIAPHEFAMQQHSITFLYESDCPIKLFSSNPSVISESITEFPAVDKPAPATAQVTPISETEIFTTNIQAESNTEFVLKLYAAKLEHGGRQTLARREADRWVLNDTPPNKAVELTKCQRYQLIQTNSIDPGFATIRATGNASVAFPTPVSMRANPSVTIPSFVIRGNGRSSPTVTGIAVTGRAHTNSVEFEVQGDFSRIGMYQTSICYMASGYTLDCNL